MELVSAPSVRPQARHAPAPLMKWLLVLHASCMVSRFTVPLHGFGHCQKQYPDLLLCQCMGPISHQILRNCIAPSLHTRSFHSFRHRACKWLRLCIDSIHLSKCVLSPPNYSTGCSNAAQSSYASLQGSPDEKQLTVPMHCIFCTLMTNSSDVAPVKP